MVVRHWVNQMEKHSSTSDKIKGNWNQFKGKLREKWGNITDDELDRVRGQREQLVGYLQEKSGQEKDAINRDVDNYARTTGYKFE